MYSQLPGRRESISRFYHVLASAYLKVNFTLPPLGQFVSLDWAAHLEALDLIRRYPNIYGDTSGIGVDDD